MTNKRAARRAIRVWLATHDRTQGWLADRLAIDEGLMSRVLTGRRAPSAAVITKLIKVTGIDLRQFERGA